jgi:hypothetical protein
MATDNGAGGARPPLAWLERLIESHRRIRLARGVVGKTGHGMLAVIAAWIVIFWRLTGDLWCGGSGFLDSGIS